MSNDISYSTTVVEKLPIPDYTEKTAPMYREIHEAVSKIINENDAQKRNELEKAIDALVIRLYLSVGKLENENAAAENELFPGLLLGKSA